MEYARIFGEYISGKLFALCTMRLFVSHPNSRFCGSSLLAYVCLSGKNSYNRAQMTEKGNERR